MSLWPLSTVAPCVQYEDHGQCYTTPPPSFVYGRHLVTCPRHYLQSWQGCSNFFFHPGIGKLVAMFTLSAAYWPSWDTVRYEWSPWTGAWLNGAAVLSRDPSTRPGVWGAAWMKGATLGSYRKIYACATTNTKISEVDYLTGLPMSGGWQVDPRTWSPSSIYGFAIVNREDNLLVGASSWTLDCWRNLNTTPVRFAQLRLPNAISYLCYESRRYCWAITKDGVILKVDYTIPRYEKISQIQNPTEDGVKFMVAFDSSRKRVIVLRLRPDAADGACQYQIEFYYPMVGAHALTQPVPVTSLRANNRIIFVSHLIGDAGEGLTPYTVEAGMVAPVEGRLITPSSGTELNGRVCHQYEAPDAACTETLNLAVTVEES